MHVPHVQQQQQQQQQGVQQEADYAYARRFSRQAPASLPDEGMLNINLSVVTDVITLYR